MALKKWADIRIELTVEFDDDGDCDLKEQAIEAACDALGVFSFYGSDEVNIVEVIGDVRDTELPK